MFDAAKKTFNFTAYRQAEAELSQFVQTFTNSAFIPEAILYQAEARIKLTNYDGALSLLLTNQPQAGKWADAYIFWEAEAHLQKGEYVPAAELFAAMIRQFPDSPRCLEAAIEQAAARASLLDWQGVVALLEQTNGVYQNSIRTNPATELAARGSLLLSEGELALKDYEAAEAALDNLEGVSLNSRMDWQRQYLLCQIRLGQEQFEEALAGSTNLLALAATTGQSRLMAQSVSLRAGLLEKLGRIEEAITAYTNNLAGSVPEKLQREALLRIPYLCLATNRIAEAMHWLEQFVTEQTNAPSADLALLTLGELRLRQAVSVSNTNLQFGWEVKLQARSGGAAVSSIGESNLLENARAPFLRVTVKYPQSPLFGKAQLDLGWCYWLETNLPPSQAAFQSAIGRLPVSADLATAYFKLGDVQYKQDNFFAALTNYLAIVDLHNNRAGFSPADWEVMETNLLERALYQAVRAGLAAGNLTAANAAASKLLDWYPNGYHTDSAVLLAGQKLNRENDPAGARVLFLELETRATNSPLLPKVQLAVARTYLQERKWDLAIDEYGRWLDAHSNDEDRPVAEFYRAWANFQAGHETNALNLLTSLIARYPTNQITPQARLWIADYYFRVGNFLEAEKNYQLLFSRDTNVSSEISYQAQMMAGRSAVQRQAWADATNYFSRLFTDPNCPVDLGFQAMFAYGDILLSLGDLKNAIEAFREIGDSTNRLAPLAWGERALCYFQYQPPQLAQATNEFQKIIDSSSPSVDATARSIARVGLATVLRKLAEQCPQSERRALLERALDEYRKVLTEVDLPEGQRPDAVYLSWVKRAGLDGAPLAEDLHEWSQASMFYKHLQDLLPPLRDALEEKRIRAEKNQLDASQ